MEFVGAALVGLVILTLLAAVGVTTIVAFGLMAVLGFVTEMSFKRVFFTSFFMALAAPILLGIAGMVAIDDGALDTVIEDSITISDADAEQWRQAAPRIRDLRDQLRNGEIDGEEFERELEQLIEETTSMQIDIEGLDGVEVRESIQIEDQSELRREIQSEIRREISAQTEGN